MDATRGNSVELQPLDGQTFTGWRHYPEVAARRLAANFPGAALGADIVFASDLPRASGMSSSSALVVAIATALVRVAGIDERPEWRANIRGTLDVAGYFACIENGLTFGTLQGDAGVGTHGGSEDHAAILGATPGRAVGVRLRADASPRAGARCRTAGGSCSRRAWCGRRRRAARRGRTTTWRAARRCCSTSGTARGRRAASLGEALASGGEDALRASRARVGDRRLAGRARSSGGSITSSARMPACRTPSRRSAPPTPRG